MKTKKRYNSKYFSEIVRVLINHINSNLKDYLILSIVFIIGVMAGVILINNSDEQSKTEVSGYINGFVETIKKDEYEVDKAKLVQISIIENFKLVLIIWLAGSTIIGIPLIYVITSYKGFCIGYTISAIITSLGFGKRYSFFNFITFFTKRNCYTHYFNVKC